MSSTMFQNFRRFRNMPLSGNVILGTLAGSLVVLSVGKIIVFQKAREMSNKAMADTHEDALRALKKAEAEGERKRKKLVARLPKMTPEQEEQMNQYLQYVVMHGDNRIFDMYLTGDTKDCPSCPVLSDDWKKKDWVVEGMSSRSHPGLFKGMFE